MSKSMVVTFPFLLLLLDFWPLKRWRLKSEWDLVIEKIPFVLLVAPVCIITYSAQKVSGQLSVFQLPLGFRLETALISYARYLGKMFWPVDFSVLYPYPDSWPTGQLLCAAALVLGISALTFVLRRQRPYLLVGWLWYLGTLVPVIGLIPLGAQSMSNRYTYLPTIGITLLVVWAINDLSKQWRRQITVMTALVTLVTGACIFRTHAELLYWQDSATLWSRAIAVTENNFMAHYCLGNVLFRSNPDQAMAEFQEAAQINPGDADTQRDTAFLLQLHGRYWDAIYHYEIAIRIQPQNSWAYNGLANSLFQAGRTNDAVSALLQAAELDGKNQNYTDELNQTLFAAENAPETLNHFLEAALANPNGFSIYLNDLVWNTNRVDFMNNCAWAFATSPDSKLRNGPFAVRLAKRACEITGYQATICVGTLAAAYAEDSQFNQAIATAQLACSLATSANDQELVKRNEELLEVFQSHKPYHEAPHTSSN
jgi:Flp pilus assembly protein TadD